MNKKNFHLFLIILFFCISCSKEIAKKSVIVEKNLELQVLETYKEGLTALEEGDVLFAAKKFNEAEILFPQSDWAPRSSLMAAYAYYTQDYYGDAISEVERFIRVYPQSKNLDYAHYLLAICYYEQIVDEKKDLKYIILSKKAFENIIKKFPDTDYALDSNFKIDMVNETLASKEMYIGRYYIKKKKWIAAMNRFRTVIDDYETTIFVQEAIHRMVELNYKLGLISEAQKYAKLLGYNYQSSEWYEKSYSVFDEMYAINKKNNINENVKKNNIIIKKFKSLFE